MRSLTVASVLFLIAALSSYAETTNTTRTITISNAVELALNNNLDLRQAEKNMLIAEAQYAESFADFWLPSINLSGSYTLIDPLTVSNAIVTEPSGYTVIGGTTVVPAGLSTISNAFPNNYAAGLTVSKAIFLGFRNLDAMQIKEINLDFARKQYEDQKQAAIYSVETSFYDLIVLRENERLDRDLNVALSNQLITSKINYNYGISSQYDYISVEVLYMNNQPKLISDSNAYEVAKMTLCNTIGIDQTNVQFVGDLMDYTNIVVSNTNEASIMELAESNSITLLSYNVALKSLGLTRAINDANFDPSLSAFANYQYNYKRDFSDTTQNWWPSWNVGLQLSFSVDSWIPISRASKTDVEYDETIKKTLLSRTEYLESLDVQVKALLLQLNQGIQNLVSQKEGLKLAETGLKIANTQFSLGQASSLDLINAETAYTQASGNYLTAIFDYFSSALQLKRLTGEFSDNKI
ncbi:MAG: TolC family protein [Brevinematales bacterium]|jgi:outer membrane protein TolC